MSATADWLAEFLGRETGLDPEVLGRSHLQGALRARMQASGIADAEEYRQRLSVNRKEKDLLLAAATIPETWFFRDAGAFTLLAREVAELTHPDRVLCAPCSTGEEAYSIAIALHGAGRRDFTVDALDLNHDALARAEAGVYDRHSFRSPLLSADRLDLYFSAEAKRPELRTVRDLVRQPVHFRQGNLNQGGTFALLSGEYDFIFCRNLLIYLQPASRKTLLERLTRKLRDGGLLFTGHAEVSCATSDALQPLAERGVFALRKGKPEGCR